MTKSIEDMTHDYVVASLRAGVPEDQIQVKELISLAEEVKTQARPIDKQLAQDDLERARYER